MTSFILLIFLVLFIIFFAVLGIGTFILSSLFGGFEQLRQLFHKLTGTNGQPNSQTRSSSSRSSSKQTNKHGTSSSGSSHTEGKMFDSNEGTYIDFEEVR